MLLRQEHVEQQALPQARLRQDLAKFANAASPPPPPIVQPTIIQPVNLWPTPFAHF
jgi:hypothetical protein